MYNKLEKISIEEAVIAEIETDLLDSLNDLENRSDSITDGIEASSKLEDIKDVVEYTANNNGIDMYSAEAIRIAIDSICDRIGAKPNYIFNFYAIENFQSDSSRIDSAKIALEGIKDFLKSIWEKIKNALISLWNKAVEIWEKHFADTARVKKALTSLKEKVENSSGIVKKEVYIENAPGKFKSAFPTADDISVNAIEKYIKVHQNASKGLNNVQTFANEINNIANKANEFIKKLESEKNPSKDNSGFFRSAFNKFRANLDKTTHKDSGSLKEDLMQSINVKDVEVNLGTEKEPLVGGIYVTFKTTTTENGINVDFDRKTVDSKDEIGLSIGSKGDLTRVINSALSLIEDAIKLKNNIKKLQDDVKRSIQSIERAISTTVINKESQAQAKPIRTIMDNYRKIMSKVPVIYTEKVTRDVKLARIVAKYVSYSLKRYE